MPQYHSRIAQLCLNVSIFGVLQKFTKHTVFAIDDFTSADIRSREANALLHIMDYRYRKASTIIVSQLEPSEWHKRIKDGLLADSILDRMLSNSYKLILSGDSMRPKL